MTRHVSFAEFRENLAKYMDEVASGGSLQIERDSSSVVMLSEKEFAGWRETIYLLQNAANAEDLLKAIKAADAGGLAEHALMGDAY